MNIRISTQTFGRALVWLIVVAPAIIDWLHGFLATELQVGLLAPAYRLTLILIGLLVLLRYPRTTTLIATGFYVAFVTLSIFLWSAYSRVFLVDELLTATNLLLLVSCYIIVSYAIRDLGVSTEYVIESVVAYGRIVAMIVIASLVLDVGIPTYSSSLGLVYGFGTQSYYIAGNVLGLSLVVALSVALYRVIESFSVRRCVEALLICTGAVCVGSRTGMFVSALMMSTACIYFIFLSGARMRHRAFVGVLVIPLLGFAGFKAYELVTQYSRMLEKLDALMAGQIRSDHSDAAWEYVNQRPAINRWFGSSYSAYVREFATVSPKRRAEESATAEQDPVDVMGAYGLVGLVVLYMPYVMGLLISGINVVLARAPPAIVAFAALLLFAGHSLIAGHVLFNSKATQFASVFLVLALTRCVRWPATRPALAVS